ncbi:hypothetical protein RCL1_006183 [Eukaryota sp. TZLM3-RCL]
MSKIPAIVVDISEVFQWTPAQVQLWLTEIGESACCDALKSLSGQDLLSLTNESLISKYNIASAGARLHLLSYINEWRQIATSHGADMTPNAFKKRAFSLVHQPSYEEDLLYRRSSVAFCPEHDTSSSLFSVPPNNLFGSTRKEVFRKLSNSASFTPTFSRRHSLPVSHQEPMPLPVSNSNSKSLYYQGRVVFVHSKANIGLIAVEKQSEISRICPLRQFDDVIVCFSTADYPWAHQLGSGTKTTPKPDQVPVIGTLVRFQLGSSDLHSLYASNVEVLKFPDPLSVLFLSGKHYYGYLYTWCGLFGFLKTRGFEVYVSQDKVKSDYSISPGDIVHYDGFWFQDQNESKPQSRNVSVIGHHDSVEVLARIVAIVPEKGVSLAIAVATGKGSIRSKCSDFDVGDDVILIRTSTILNSRGLSDQDLIDRQLRVVVLAHNSGYWQGRTCFLTDINDPNTSSITNILPKIPVKDVAPDTRMEGFVSRILVKEDGKQYGFLTPLNANLDAEVYFHFGRVLPGRNTLKEGSRVEFVLIYSSTGKPQARDVIVLDD